MEQEPITLKVSRDQAWDIYDLLVAKAVTIESAEELAMSGFGSKRYRDAADAVKAELEAVHSVAP